MLISGILTISTRRITWITCGGHKSKLIRNHSFIALPSRVSLFPYTQFLIIFINETLHAQMGRNRYFHQRASPQWREIEEVPERRGIKSEIPAESRYEWQFRRQMRIDLLLNKFFF